MDRSNCSFPDGFAPPNGDALTRVAFVHAAMAGTPIEHVFPQVNLHQHIGLTETAYGKPPHNDPDAARRSHGVGYIMSFHDYPCL